MDLTTVREGDILQGKYRVERVLGRGGMGFVLGAHHLHLDEKVAIKSLLPEGRGHAEVVRRFEREARTAVKIKSEHVARVLDVARFDDGTPYLVMEHLDGQDLSKWLQTRGPLAIEQAVEFVVQACEAMAEAHSLGIVHRDLKPANVFVVRGRDGLLMAKVIDFGIAKSAELGSRHIAMTRTHSIIGSPEYMSPEQFTAPKTVDWRTDIWSIGATLFELLTGRTPFPGDDLVTLVMKITQEPFYAIGQVPPGLLSVIRRCLEKDRGARYQDVAELAVALAPFAPSRTQALIQRIGRIVNGSRSASLAATVAAPPVPPVPPVSESAMTPYVRTISAPMPAPKTRDWPILMALACAAAGVLVMLVLCMAVYWRTPMAATAAPTEQQAPTRVTWRFGSDVYHAVIHTNGETGYADVSFVEPGEGPVVVRENLTLQRGPRGWTYVGSNPRYVDDGAPANFIPNVFSITEGKLVETCAIGTGACTPVVTEN